MVEGIPRVSESCATQPTFFQPKHLKKKLKSRTLCLLKGRFPPVSAPFNDSILKPETFKRRRSKKNSENNRFFSA